MSEKEFMNLEIGKTFNIGGTNERYYQNIFRL